MNTTPSQFKYLVDLARVAPHTAYSYVPCVTMRETLVHCAVKTQMHVMHLRNECKRLGGHHKVYENTYNQTVLGIRKSMSNRMSISVSMIKFIQ